LQGACLQRSQAASDSAAVRPLMLQAIDISDHT
jgi:hypothetical protein